MTSLELFMLGANPPSSPTFVFKPFDFKSDFNEWNISQPYWSASEKLFAPIGATINSWISTSLSACDPPLIMFIIGTGRLIVCSLPRKEYNSWPSEEAKHFAKAKLAASVALAPKLDLFSVPSSSNKKSSKEEISSNDFPTSSLEIVSLIFPTAFRTPLPLYLDLSLSRNSRASCTPVDAPLGTAALPNLEFSNSISHSTVGFPLLSIICLAFILVILGIVFRYIIKFFKLN